MALPAVAVDALRGHRERQSAERVAAGELWSDQGLVFCSQVGTPLDPANLRKRFARWARRAGIDGNVVPYLVRHSAASLLLDAGASIEDAADLLGDDPQTLYRHYRHRVRPVAEAGLRMQALLASESFLGASPAAVIETGHGSKKADFGWHQDGEHVLGFGARDEGCA